MQSNIFPTRPAHRWPDHCARVLTPAAYQLASLYAAGVKQSECEAVLSQIKTSVEQATPLLLAAVAEAREVLAGHAAASDRLWLILRDAANRSVPQVPDSWLRQAYGDSTADSPHTLQKEIFMDLIGATVWSARSAAEEQAMMDALRQLLDPFLQLELAVIASRNETQTHTDLLQHLVLHHSLGNNPPHTYDQPTTKFGDRIWKDRVDLDTAGTYDPLGRYHKDWTDIWGCGSRGRRAVSIIDRFGGRYTITGISNPNACAGETISIYGTNLGTEGRVYFPIPEVTDPAFQANTGGDMLIGVTAISWTNTVVTVKVPPWAVSGRLHLNAFHRIVELCWIKDIYRLGNDWLFTGGLASVYEVYVNGSDTGSGAGDHFVIKPNDTFLLGYRATNRSNVTVTVEIRSGATVFFQRFGLAGGFQTFPAQLTTDPGVPTQAELIITAVSPCGSTQPMRVPVILAVTPTLRIEYVEVTQGVQVDKAAVLAGQGVPLVANKDTALRVYFFCDRGGWFENKLDKITGSLTMTTASGNPQLAPTNARPVIPDKGYMQAKGLSRDIDAFSTLNFLIPSGWCTPGTHTLTVTVRCNDLTGNIVLKQSFPWTWTARNTVRVRWMVLNPGNYTQYSVYPQADELLRKSLHYLPTSVYDVGPAWKNHYEHDFDLTDKDEWGELLDDIESFKNCTVWDDINPFSDHCESLDDDARWVALVLDEVNTEGSNRAGNSHTPGMVVVSKMTAYIIAHELGHTLGRHHVNVAAKDQGIDGPFETVENGGYLSRAAFDVQNQQPIFGHGGQPDNAGRINDMPTDLMAYYKPLFLSVTNWKRIFNSL